MTSTTYIKHHPDLVKVISYKEYHPDKQRGVLTNDAGHLVLNKYDISLVPVVDGVYTEAGLKAVELIRQHFIILTLTKSGWCFIYVVASGLVPFCDTGIIFEQCKFIPVLLYSMSVFKSTYLSIVWHNLRRNTFAFTSNFMN
jgi:hypothetical protein